MSTTCSPPWRHTDDRDVTSFGHLHVVVGRFELDTPGHGIHDVWISDGVAFSSNTGNTL